MGYLPGGPPINIFTGQDHSIDTIIINGAETDLMGVTNQYFVKTGMEKIQKGISLLKSITGIEKIYITLPKDLIQWVGDIGAKPVGVESEYPAANPRREIT